MYLQREHYTTEKSAVAEYQKVFRKAWLFAGLTTELAKPNDYVVFDIFDTSVVIHNFNGTLAAFQNVCAHRFNKIHTGTRGNRPFFCQYHGWSFNKDGKATGVPRRDTFDAKELENTALTKFAVDTCGKFIFVKLDWEHPETLADFLGVYYQELAETSQYFDKEVYFDDIHHKGNWKLLVENVNEGYHCATLHPNTLIKSGFCRTPPESVFNGKHSKWESMKVTNDANSIDHKHLAFLKSRPYQHDSYRHMHLYPNCFLASTEGYLFYFASVLPIDAENCILRVRYYNPVLTDTNKPALQKAFFDSAVQIGVNILMEEDKPVIEQCQKGLKQDSGLRGMLSSVEEIRIIRFHEEYLKDLENV